MSAIKSFVKIALVLFVLVVAGAIAYAMSGLYDISVGSGHSSLTNWYLETLRDRSIERRAAGIEVPRLEGADMIVQGAISYDNGCAGCHGRPGRPPRDRWEPAPPALTRSQPDPAGTFWVVRNGIKMSAMPAYPAQQIDDSTVWNIVAFLQTAASLTEGEYREMVEPPPEPEQEPEPEAEPAPAAEVDQGAEQEPEADSETQSDS